MKKRRLIFAAIALVLAAAYIYRTYPRHVDITLQGVQYHADAPGQGIKPVTVAVHGTVEHPLFGLEKFDGTINILGASVPYPANGKFLRLSIIPQDGGLIPYLKSNQARLYGEIYPNRNFTALAVTEWQNSGWSSANGLVIAVPARTRAQAVHLSNVLMRQSQLLFGRRLK